MGEENIVRHKAWDRDDLPAGGGIENIAQPTEIRNTAGLDPELTKSIEVFAACAPLEQPLLTFEEQPPDRVVFLGIPMPVLIGCKICGSFLPGPGHRLLQICFLLTVIGQAADSS